MSISSLLEAYRGEAADKKLPQLYMEALFVREKIVFGPPRAHTHICVCFDTTLAQKFKLMGLSTIIYINYILCLFFSNVSLNIHMCIHNIINKCF